MQLIPPQESHLVQMLNWFESEKALRDWAGPDFRFPFDLVSFTDDLQLNTLNSLVLISTEGEFLGFGQFYLRVTRCHLARLVVNPRLRGKGYAPILIEQLCEIAHKKLKLEEYSLFVFADNQSAIKSYTRCGFAVANYPGEIPLTNCLYMVRT